MIVFFIVQSHMYIMYAVILVAASVFRPTWLVGGVSTTKCAVEHQLLAYVQVGKGHVIMFYFLHNYNFIDKFSTGQNLL